MCAFLGRPKAEAVITGMIFVSYQPTFALFYWRTNYSYVYPYFATYLELFCESLPVPMPVASPVGESLVMDQVN